MQIGKYLEKYQSALFKTFSNALKENRLSHAYLISGPTGTPLYDTAFYLAKSIVCDDPSPLACNNCISCMRVDDNNYPDFLVFDGSSATIKKEDVTNIESQFDKTAFEHKGKMIYILHLIENMSIEAINSILKFLEEPGKEIYAFLTTNNENAVLPTIISRCQVWRLKQIDRKEVISKCLENNIKQEDAEILSYLYNDETLIEGIINDKDTYENFQISVGCVNDILDNVATGSKANVSFTIEHLIIPVTKTKEQVRFLLDTLVDFYQNAINFKNGKDIYLESYATIVETLSKSAPHIEQTLIELLKERNKLNANINVGLCLDHLTLLLMEE